MFVSKNYCIGKDMVSTGLESFRLPSDEHVRSIDSETAYFEEMCFDCSDPTDLITTVKGANWEVFSRMNEKRSR